MLECLGRRLGSVSTLKCWEIFTLNYSIFTQKETSKGHPGGREVYALIKE